ncbi:hypothetical protein P154DRAFT_526585 [Amniculicola lignicola CBS 123094]|uniref:Exocyst complex component Sec8 n=1 Tax=Amniculicola lignicola CBS 123094 TaxID=1392246 RepID=A0A6A5VZH6_9PLEO|nr:hypothetical protein P154DRAFT_526585 [Amniculicola lignicola CBS 123094]
MSRIPPGGMRPGANGTNGYGGGYGQYGAGADNENPRRPSPERRRRPGGYGGFGDREEEAPRSQPPSQERVERLPPRRRSGDRGGYNAGGDGGSRSRARPTAPANYGPGSERMEEILQYIQDNFDFMTKDKCVPIQIALKLLDSSSLGLASQHDRFHQTHQDLQRALKAIVNEHHQGFNSSIGTFHKIQSSLQQSQHRVRTLKDSLTQAKTHLSTTKPELKELATSSQNYDEMIQILNAIEQLQLVPDKLEARISEKRFLSAVDILQDALRTIRRSDMESIGALSDLRVYLSNQEHSLTDILIEELHNHLYLKSPYCEDRWRGYAQNQPKGEPSDRPPNDLRGRLLYHFLDQVDTSKPMSDDSPQNPEADTFQYIQLVVESLNKMNRLDIAMDTIEQRLPVELFKVVEKSNNEVAQRHPSILRAFSTRKGQASSSVDSDDVRSALLNDLLWTLYARFEAIAESHRVVHDVVTGVVRREGIRDSSSAALTRGFKELWKLYQSEMRSLLHDYLATDGDLVYRGGQGPKSSGSAFSRAPRDKNKRMFKLTDMDTKSSELATERDDLEFILKSSVPGLVSDSKRPGDLIATHSTNLDGSATGHKLLVEPSVFNMGILLPPSLDFLNRLKEVVPSNSDIVMSTLTSFLDDFLVNVFHPQLDETLIEMSTQTFIELDAFQQEPQWAQYSKKPIFKGTAKFFTLITAFCKMLDNLPHDQAFTQLIISQMVTYYEKCNGWYKALVSRGQPKEGGRLMKAPAAYAQSGEFETAISALFQAEPSKVAELVDKETLLLLAEVEKDPLDLTDLVRDKKTITSLCLLYTSMKWLATKIAQLRYISDRATDSSREPNNPRHNQRWTLLASTEPRSAGVPVYLPLNRDTAAEFDSLVLSYQTLSTTVLRTLHLSLRTMILHALTSSIQPSYLLTATLNEPAQEILSLNSQLVSIDSEISTYIPTTMYHPCVTTGLSALMDRAFLRLVGSGKIDGMNANGAQHMEINILVLQQNLLNIEPGASLPLSSLFFELFNKGPEAIMARAREYGNDFGVGGKIEKGIVEQLIKLWYSERVASDRREVSMKAQRESDAMLLEISEFIY